jgi:hypothetical protein
MTSKLYLQISNNQANVFLNLWEVSQGVIIPITAKAARVHIIY